MSCPCSRVPDPGVCPIAHDGWSAGGHCRCAHPGYRPPVCECFADAEAGALIMCATHWRALEEELSQEPNIILALARLARRVGNRK